jgi:hypothetical protein
MTPYLIPKQDVGFATLAAQTCINLVSRVLVHTFKFSVSRSQSSPRNQPPRVPPWWVCRSKTPTTTPCQRLPRCQREEELDAAPVAGDGECERACSWLKASDQPSGRYMAAVCIETYVKTMRSSAIFPDGGRRIRRGRARRVCVDGR